jgi:hypothetical protein
MYEVIDDDNIRGISIIVTISVIVAIMFHFFTVADEVSLIL